ncbi:unnamed protein product [Bursaphelenchus xylophilus]|uniref:(pine wood nematode) hypothetical protein n=1 Tax=Bursaphelenchus xylophilus TaxID=6326 RepID=A0A1I7RVK7_BURXY|nr:unnamed protein product [Bursaphelenchus xylophilus]CAG9081817.1 unnamed protein product [Bursaphelenchus xylophilus]
MHEYSADEKKQAAVLGECRDKFAERQAKYYPPEATNPPDPCYEEMNRCLVYGEPDSANCCLSLCDPNKP